MKRHLKQLLAILIVVGTIGAFVYYFGHHPQAWQRLTDIPPLTLGLLFLLYAGTIVSVALILLATVRLCYVQLPAKDGLLLTMWSSIINFFGPLQSGPAFRAVYLRKAYKVSLKNYGVATLLYYGFYALYSGVFLLSGLIHWYILLILLLIVGGGGLYALFRTNFSQAKKIRALPLREAYKLALATLLQVVLVAIIYTVELKSIDTHISFHQAIIYTGAANFALFVSITPGAIGFREAFLVFSERLHHINASAILTANLIDRTIYVILLSVLFVIALTIHAQNQLLKKAAKSSS